MRCADAPFRVNNELNLNRWSPTEIVRNLTAIRRAVAEFKPDVLNAHCPPGHTYFALAQGAAGAEVPLVRTVAEPREPKSNPLNRYLHRQCTDGLIYSTASSVARYRALMAESPVPQRVVLPGFRSSEFTAGVANGGFRAQQSLSPDVMLAGVIARMAPEKGQEVLIEALALMPAEIRSRLHVVMAGEDSRERGQRQLRELAVQRGVEQSVTLLPKLSDVRPLMSELDLGIITSTTSEAICRVALEYMSFGIPVISSDVNILPEVVVDGRNGWVFANRDAGMLARLLAAAVASPQHRASRGATGRSMVRAEFSPERELADTLACYAEATNYRRSRRA
jgi:glycosyltransferase involved in cell wall biosynthesis